MEADIITKNHKFQNNCSKEKVCWKFFDWQGITHYNFIHESATRNGTRKWSPDYKSKFA
jgi:hypothetical protein